MKKDFKGQIGFYLLLDTAKSRSIRTVINLETTPMPEQFAAQGHYIGPDRIGFWDRLEDPKWNYCSRFYIRQFDPEQKLKIEIVSNFVNGNITFGRNNKFIYNNPPKEISENHLKTSFERGLLSDHLTYKRTNVYRQRFLIKERNLPAEQQPLNQNNEPLYDTHEINWDIIYCKLKLLDSISVSTASRDCYFNLHYPYDHSDCRGAIIKECDSNNLKNFYEIKSLT